jgi:hypothetical protein
MVYTWTWARTKKHILNLKGRLGFKDGSVLDVLKYELDLMNGTVKDILNDRTVVKNTIRNLILCLFYWYSQSKPVPKSDELITTRQLHGGHFCDFAVNRAKTAILNKFGELEKSKYFDQSSTLLGGRKFEFHRGDYSVIITPLPRTPLIFVFMEKDMEFPASVDIFFYDTIKNYLDLELVGMMIELTAKRLGQALDHLYPKNK